MSLTDRDIQLVKNFLIGGSAIGGAAALGTSLVNYMKYLKSQGNSDTSKDDDTLYINLRRPANKEDLEAAEKEASLGGPLALTGGALALIGTNALVRNIYQRIKRKELQAKLDAAQQGYADVLETEAEQNKAASFTGGKGMGAGEAITSIPLTMAILLSLASGVVANKTLHKSFPGVTKPVSKDPKRVVIRSENVSDSPDDDDEDHEVKLANAQEFMIRTVIGADKSADTKTSIAALSQGRLNNMVEALTYGYDTMMDMVKGASHEEGDPIRDGMAISIAVRHPGLSQPIGLMAASEYIDLFPVMSKLATALPEDTQDVLLGIASCFGRAARYTAMAPIKSAFEDAVPTTDPDREAAPLSIDDIIQMILEQRNEQVDVGKQGPDTDSSNESVPSAEGDRVKSKDAIDGLLA